jgi:hypothetical protein
MNEVRMGNMHYFWQALLKSLLALEKSLLESRVPLFTELPRRRMFTETGGIPAPKRFSRVVVLSLLRDGKDPGLQVPL